MRRIFVFSTSSDNHQSGVQYRKSDNNNNNNITLRKDKESLSKK